MIFSNTVQPINHVGYLFRTTQKTLVLGIVDRSSISFIVYACVKTDLVSY